MKRIVTGILSIALCISILAGIPATNVFAKEAKTGKAIAKVEKKLVGDTESIPGKKLNKNIKESIAAGDYIYYLTTKSPSLFRMKSDGTGRERVDTYVRDIYMIKDGFIYYNRFGNLFRIGLDGSGRQRLVRSNYGQEFVIKGDRVYYVVQKLVNDMTGTDYSYVRSKKLDGSDVKKEIKKRSGWGHISMFGDTVIVEYPPLEGEEEESRYVLGANGQWTKVAINAISGISMDSFASPEDNMFYYLTEKADYEDDERENAIYAMDITGNVTKLIDLDKAGVKLTGEVDSLSKDGKYFIIVTAYDQSMGDLYVLNESGRKLRTVDLGPVGEDGSYNYRIVDDVLYVSITGWEGTSYYYFNLGK